MEAYKIEMKRSLNTVGTICDTKVGTMTLQEGTSWSVTAYTLLCFDQNGAETKKNNRNTQKTRTMEANYLHQRNIQNIIWCMAYYNSDNNKKISRKYGRILTKQKQHQKYNLEAPSVRSRQRIK